MKRLGKLTVILALFFIAENAYTQDMEKVRTALTSVREAYDGGNYRIAVEKIKIVENEIGSTTKPATAYIKIMSYYKLKEYQNCTDAANAYLNGGEAKQDETLTEIHNAMQESQRILSEREAERQRQFAAQEAERKRILAAQEAERRRKEEAARAKAAHEKEAAERWQKISTSEDLMVLSAFLDKYGSTPSKAAAQACYDDEKAWQDAQKSKITDNYEAYLKGSTLKRHKVEAEQMLEYNLPRHFKKYTDKGDISNMKNIYRRYMDIFPSGSQLTTMKQTIAQAYLTLGAQQASTKNTSTLRTAIENIEQSRDYAYQPQSVVIDLIQKTETKLRRQKIRQGDYGWFALTADR